MLYGVESIELILKVALIYNTSNAANTVAAELASTNNVRAAAYQANVGIQSEIEAVVQQIAKDFGRLDIMVVNSGIVSSIAAEDYTSDQWSEIMKVNLDGAFYSAQAAGRIFKEQGRGNVIFTASVSATLVNVPQKQAAVSLPHFLMALPIRSSLHSIIHPKQELFSWPSACLSNGLIFVELIVSRLDTSLPTFSIPSPGNGARSG